MPVWLVNPSYAEVPPDRKVRLCFLFALAWLALPLLTAVPYGVAAGFAGLWLVQLLRTFWRRVASYPWWLLCGCAVGGFLVSPAGTVVGIEGGGSLLLWLVVLKTYETRTLRDWQVLLAAMVFLCGAGVVANQEMWTGLWLLPALFVLAACAALLYMPWRFAWRYAGLSLLLTLPLAGLLFVAVPRADGPLWRIPQPRGAQGTTGLSDTMQPGSISELVQSNELAFNAVFRDGFVPQRQMLYWRAVTMSRFDGVRWYADGGGRNLAAVPVSERFAAYDIIIRDGQGRLPALDYPLLLAARDGGNDLRLEAGYVVRVRSHDGLRRFQLQAALTDRLPESLNEAERRRLTALSEGNPRLRALAGELRARAPDTAGFVGNVLAYYRRERFAYTLTPPLMSGPDRVDDFMFAAKRGFCEHYAESFVLAMRAGGVPARVVTGYLGGGYNEEGGFWQVRGRDAHAWAEVWLEETGEWLRVDPTAEANAELLEQGLEGALSAEERALIGGSSGWAWWDGFSARSQYYWQQWVVNFDRSAQQDLFRKLGLAQLGVFAFVPVLLVGITAGVLPLWLWWRRQKRRVASHLEAGFGCIRSLLPECEGRRPESVGALEAVSILRREGLLTPELEKLLRQYNLWNYAAAPPDAAVQRRWHAACRRAVRRVRRRLR